MFLIKKILFTFIFLVLLFNVQAQKASYERIFNLLTGGPGSSEGKTWKFDASPSAFHVLSPYNDTTVYYYWFFQFGAADSAWNNGIVQNSYTFRYDSIYHPKNTTVTVCAQFEPDFGSPLLFTNIAVDDPHHKDAPFTLTYNDTTLGTGYTITIKDSSYIGLFQKRYKYYIMRISEDSLRLGQTCSEDTSSHPENDILAKYFTYYSVSSNLAGTTTAQSTSQKQFFYPNPAGDMIYFREGISSAVVYNQLGNAVLTWNGNSLAVDQLPPGIYQVQVKDDQEHVYFQKLVKLQ